MIDMKFDGKRFLQDLRALETMKAAIMPKVYQTFLDNTPIRYGNAKSNTILQNNIIIADYEYASVLDAGRGYRGGQMRGSIQAPKGMSAPAIDSMNNEVAIFISKKTKGA